MKDEGGEIEGEEWVWVANPVHRIYETGWIHMNIAWFETQEISWVNNMAKGPSPNGIWTPYDWAWSTRGDAASSYTQVFSSPSFLQGSKSVWSSQSIQTVHFVLYTDTHMINRREKRMCKKKKKKFKLKKYLKMVMAKTVKLRFSIYNEHMWLRQLTQS